jgi:carbon monoxide dehydrogenase subunit G
MDLNVHCPRLCLDFANNDSRMSAFPTYGPVAQQNGAVKVTGSATLNASRDDVWKALNDPAVLVRTIPGCQQLEEVGPDSYRMTITAGVASIKGTYLGDVSLTDQQQPGSFMLHASGAGSPGTVSADVKVSLAELDGVTRLDYDADAVVGGMIGGVGQRVLSGVAKKTAGEFFQAVDDVLTGKAPEPVAASVGSVATPGVFSAPVPTGAATDRSDFVKGAVFGAGVALAGVLVGSYVTRRRG